MRDPAIQAALRAAAVEHCCGGDCDREKRDGKCPWPKNRDVAGPIAAFLRALPGVGPFRVAVGSMGAAVTGHHMLAAAVEAAARPDAEDAR